MALMTAIEDATARFRAGDIRLLVATTVIEVGVDVTDATIMVIEQAERFGLAQLHQLRGRVGRGDRPSHCLLMYKPPLGETARARLEILRQTNDGFRIAEEDLRLRGEGWNAVHLEMNPAKKAAEHLKSHGPRLVSGATTGFIIGPQDPFAAVSLEPVIDAAPVPFPHHARGERPAPPAAQRKRRQRPQHCADPGDDAAPEDAETHAVGDGDELGGEGHEGMHHHQQHRARHRPHAL